MIREAAMNARSATLQGLREMSWAVKDGLVEYVLDEIPDGRVELSAGATEGDGRRYSFPLDSRASDFDPVSGRGVARFRGAVVFNGYGGMLRLAIAQPWLEFQDEIIIFTLAGGGEFSSRDRILVSIMPAVDIDAECTAIPVVLAESAVSLFLGRYPAGQLLSPVEVER